MIYLSLITCRGKICFWNGHTGINTEAYQSHEADILCLALSEDQSTVYCSGERVDPLLIVHLNLIHQCHLENLSFLGVDPVIATFTRITIRSSAQQSLQNGIITPMGSAKPVPQRSQWCRSANRRIHDHDVRAMAICHDKLCSGGQYSFLLCAL